MLRLGRREFGDHECVVMAVLDRSGDLDAVLSRVAGALSAGAAIVQITGPDPVALVAAVRDRHPGLIIAVETGDPGTAEAACAAGADLIDDPSGRGADAVAESAARHGAGLVCAPGAVERALALGVRPEGVLVAEPAGPREATRRAAELAAGGHPVLVRLPEPSPTGAALATAALSAWLGARVFRAHEVATARQTLDMVASIAGRRPPAVALRGMG